jgi:hypothetical protein
VGVCREKVELKSEFPILVCFFVFICFSATDRVFDESDAFSSLHLFVFLCEICFVVECL